MSKIESDSYKKIIANTFKSLGSEQKKTLLNRINIINNSEIFTQIKLPETKQFKKELVKAVFFSPYTGTCLTKFPGLLADLIDSKSLEKSYNDEDMYKNIKSSIKNLSRESEVKKAVFMGKLRENIRIAWRDLNHKAKLEETLNDLSLLADTCIKIISSTIYDELSKTYGFPKNVKGCKQKLIILGMGKLGAKELNFSSDIDLIFIYPEPGFTDSKKSISNEEFFIKMCRKLIKVLGEKIDGINFFRVDTRLRPFGATGPLVMTSREIEEYYQAQGREWERYALIKARPLAGDIESGYKLLNDLNSFIYRRYFDYGTFDSFKDMKERISLQIKNQNMQDNIKSGPGGIREIEFFGQIFQLIRGGIEPELQERKILKVLESLFKYSCIDSSTKKALIKAYIFLRKTENRLQEYNDLQTHNLPKNEDEKACLAISMDFQSYTDFYEKLDEHRTNVHKHFKELLYSEEDEIDDSTIKDYKSLWLNINDPQSLISTKNIIGFENVNTIAKHLQQLEEHPKTKRLASSARKKLNRLVPLLLQKASKSNNPDIVLMRLIDLIITIESRSCYISLLLENRGALQTLSTLAEKSPWIISFLSQHPALLDELLDTKKLYSPPEKKELESLLKRRMSKIADNNIEFLLEELSVFKQTNILRVASADISKNYPLMKVSDKLTYIAETVLDKILEISWNIVVAKYGYPQGVFNDKTKDKLKSCGFAIVTYGKVGGIETGYKSDLDLIFICSATEGMTRYGKKNIENTAFYSILSQRIISGLTMHTAAGQLYGADMRLRPGGQSGTIVTKITAIEEYFETTAWTWEHQALIRARPVCGDTNLQKKFNKIRKKIISKKRDPELLRKEVLDMRQRMQKEHIKIKKGFFDIKYGKGGIIDIEFLVQYLVLKNSISHNDLTKWTDNIRLLETLAKENIILEQESNDLKQAYINMRKAIHHLNLQEKEILLPDTHFKTLKKNVIAINKKYFKQVLS